MRPTDLFTSLFGFLGIKDVVTFEISGDYRTGKVRVKTETLVRDSEGLTMFDREWSPIRKLGEFALVHESELPKDEDEK